MKSPLPEAVKKSVLLNGLSEDMRENLLKDSVRRSYREGETIFVQGDVARAVFIVLSGFVKLSRMTPSGTEAVVTIMGRNRSFAEAMVLRGEPYPVSAEAIDLAITGIVEKLLTLGEREISSEKIGEMVMAELKHLDKVAYVRFASVYRNFEDVDEFSDIIREVSHPSPRHP